MTDTMTQDSDEVCPVGDPECDAPDDGEWHCHDACTPGPGRALTPDEAAQMWAAITGVHPTRRPT